MSLTNGAKHDVANSLFEEIVLPFVMSQRDDFHWWIAHIQALHLLNRLFQKHLSQVVLHETTCRVGVTFTTKQTNDST